MWFCLRGELIPSPGGKHEVFELPKRKSHIMVGGPYEVNPQEKA